MEIEPEGSFEAPFEMRSREVDAASGKAVISYLICEPLESAGFINAFSTRTGGVSSLPSDSLNLSLFKGDTKENVQENRRRFLQALGAERHAIVTAHQTHSTKLCRIDSAGQDGLDCDALSTRLSHTLIGVQTADCLPILIADPKTKTAAAIHAGWRGTAGRITERAVASLMQSGLDPRNSIAALGPCACIDCYEIGSHVIDLYKKEFGYWRYLLSKFTDDGKAHLDIQSANIQQLEFCGFDEDRIHVAPHCTMHNNDLFFSYRREGNGQPSKVGRLLSVIGKS
ncbi:MAG: peptidoglycan editing factor PgeF [Blastocatellia bacterium AA13]|nr:MAG: peptidoglycan editing factor PgeF [Blastocatellia bacterium AA13]